MSQEPNDLSREEWCVVSRDAKRKWDKRQKTLANQSYKPPITGFSLCPCPSEKRLEGDRRAVVRQRTS